MGLNSKEIKFFIFSISTSTILTFLLAQPSTQGFISLDCGIPTNQSYIDTTTNLAYNSDYEFIGAGTSHNIASNFLNQSPPKQYQTTRSFQNGSRNCYTLRPIIKGQRYLLRAGFMYGNYDGLNSKLISFDLYIGVNIWKSINITNAASEYTAEIITLAVAEFIFVCLVNTGNGTPFVSLLEMRPLKESIYKNADASQSLNLYSRVYMGPSIVRYPEDRYDRVWHTWDQTQDYSNISTDKTISNSNNDDFEAPSASLQFAVTPATGFQLNISWGDGNNSTEFFFVFYFSEIVVLGISDVRMFSIYYNSLTEPWAGPFTPPYLFGLYYYVNGFFTGLTEHNFSLQATSNSTMTPIINAMEVYTRLVPTQVMTDLTDAEAMNVVKKDYQVKKNWMGDPCSPVQYAWDGLKCIYGTNGTKIIRVDLSYSKLSGGISNSFASLHSVQFLDLSHNNLTGTIPDFLGNMTSLQVLNLSGNTFTGPIPDSLLNESNSGLLILVINSDEKSCGDNNSCSRNKKIATPILIIIGVVPSLVILLLAGFIIWLTLCRTVSDGGSMRPLRRESFPRESNGPIENVNLESETENLNIEGRKFSYKDLENITNKFVKSIGKGGFGVVYYGQLENGMEIAVKMSTASSAQGRNEFFAEVNSLTKVHHKNLVSLIGYCMDVSHLALVFEYMPLGSFKDHLSGRTSIARVLTWRERLRIAFESAKGLDYLHTGCDIIHRDVKSSNILLGPNLEAKLSDFGLSKFSDQLEESSYNSIGIVGTPGYIDPESSTTIRLTYKSDVYSFGVILLEMLTGEPPTTNLNGGSHIANRVSIILSKGDINEIMDPKLDGKFNPKSAWKIVELAMKCVKGSSSQRPTMSEVVLCLKECLESEEGFYKRDVLYSDLEGFVFNEKDSAGPSNVKTVKFAPLETEISEV